MESVEKRPGPGRPPGRQKLTGKEQAFLDEYFVDFNATQAYIRAGYQVKGNPQAIRNSVEMMAKPKIKAAIEVRMKQRREKTELSAEYVIQKLIQIVEDTESENPQAALRGLELLGRNLGLYRDKQEISGPDGDAIRVQEQRTEENVSDFTRKLSRLAATRGTGNVVEFPGARGEGAAEL